MKKKFTKLLLKKELLPLSIYLLESTGTKDSLMKPNNIIKLAKATRINSDGYVVGSFYKPISKL